MFGFILRFIMVVSLYFVCAVTLVLCLTPAIENPLRKYTERGSNINHSELRVHSINGKEKYFGI